MQGETEIPRGEDLWRQMYLNRRKKGKKKKVKGGEWEKVKETTLGKEQA